jgi:hypothetical protein
MKCWVTRAKCMVHPWKYYSNPIDAKKGSATRAKMMEAVKGTLSSKESYCWCLRENVKATEANH